MMKSSIEVFKTLMELFFLFLCWVCRALECNLFHKEAVA